MKTVGAIGLGLATHQYMKYTTASLEDDVYQ